MVITDTFAMCHWYAHFMLETGLRQAPLFPFYRQGSRDSLKQLREEVSGGRTCSRAQCGHGCPDLQTEHKPRACTLTA